MRKLRPAPPPHPSDYPHDSGAMRAAGRRPKAFIARPREAPARRSAGRPAIHAEAIREASRFQKPCSSEKAGRSRTTPAKSLAGRPGVRSCGSRGAIRLRTKFPPPRRLPGCPMKRPFSRIRRPRSSFEGGRRPSEGKNLQAARICPHLRSRGARGFVAGFRPGRRAAFRSREVARKPPSRDRTRRADVELGRIQANTWPFHSFFRQIHNLFRQIHERSNG